MPPSNLKKKLSLRSTPRLFSVRPAVDVNCVHIIHIYHLRIPHVNHISPHVIHAYKLNPKPYKLHLIYATTN